MVWLVTGMHGLGLDGSIYFQHLFQGYPLHLTCSLQPTFFNELLCFYLKQLLEAVRYMLEGYGLVNDNDEYLFDLMG